MSVIGLEGAADGVAAVGAVDASARGSGGREAGRRTGLLFSCGASSAWARGALGAASHPADTTRPPRASAATAMPGLVEARSAPDIAASWVAETQSTSEAAEAPA